MAMTKDDAEDKLEEAVNNQDIDAKEDRDMSRQDSGE
jgi:hypothetical protein